MTTHRAWVLSLPDNRVHVTNRPRRCIICDAPVLVTPDGTVLDDRKRHRGLTHRC